MFEATVTKLIEAKGDLIETSIKNGVGRSSTLQVVTSRADAKLEEAILYVQHLQNVFNQFNAMAEQAAAKAVPAAAAAEAPEAGAPKAGAPGAWTPKSAGDQPNG